VRASAASWIALAALATACQQAPPSAKPLVVASFYPLYEFARQVAGGHAEVVSLVPPGVEPHDWEPSPQDIVRVQQARLFVYNGSGFEAWMDKLLKDVGAKDTLLVNTTAGIEVPPAGSGDLRRGRAGPDPHVWLDPVMAQAQVDAIRAGLERVDPAHKAAYAANAAAFQARLAALDAAFAQGLRDCARRDLVTSHAAFGHLARRYGLTQVPVTGLAPDSEPSPAELAAVVAFVRRHEVKYVFFETLVSPRLAETLAREVGARTLVLNPVEGLTREEAAAGLGYIALMEANLQNLRTALGCR
jgi:zinc transport system substrate-binding protein